MNKVGRRKVEERVAMISATRQFLVAENGAQVLVTEQLDRMMSERTTFGRWLAWIPVGSVDRFVGEVGDDFIRNTVRIEDRQPWVFRFIGRRRLHSPRNGTRSRYPLDTLS